MWGPLRLKEARWNYDIKESSAALKGTKVTWLILAFERKGKREEILSFIAATLEAESVS